MKRASPIGFLDKALKLYKPVEVFHKPLEEMMWHGPVDKHQPVYATLLIIFKAFKI